jgi:16S rRNA (cytidine1402-2'-O)-methyltransferase
MTKLHEDIRRGSLAHLATMCAGDEPRGEIVLVIAPPAAAEPVSAADAETLLRDALGRVSLKDAVAEVADATGLPRRDVYQQALALSKDKDLAKDKDHGAPR